MTGENPITITMPSTVTCGTLITGEVRSSHPKIRRVTLWFFAPGVVPGVGQTWNDLKTQRIKSMSQSLSDIFDKPGKFRKRSSKLALSTGYHAVAHVPDEPGSVGGNTVVAAMFDLVA